MTRFKEKVIKTKFENNWLSKTLESLEKDYWGAIPTDESYLITTCHKLRKKQLKDFETEDLREMIGQDIGLKYLIPLAIEVLKKDILAEGHLYEGDVLKSVLTSDESYWKEEKKYWKDVCELFKKNEVLLKNNDTTVEIKKGWFDAFKKFETINK